MAIIYPKNPRYYNNSYGEKQIFEALQNLNDDYVIFYSTMWQEKRNFGVVLWGEADFTIFHKKKGILVVEVKSGDISYKNNEWYQTRLDTKETHIMQNPLVQADRSKYRFINLIKQNIPYEEKCRVEKIVWFPSIYNLDEIHDVPLEYSKKIILTLEALNEPEKYLNAAFEHYNMQNSYSLSNASIQRIISLLAPEFNLISEPKNRIEEIEYSFLRLTDEQLKLLDYIEEQKFATIQGCAGTGKTVIAIEAAKRMAKQGNQVLFLCFNKFLYEHLYKNYYSIDNITILNLHMFLNYYGTSIYNENEIQKIMDGITYSHFNYDSVIIDEAQDFPEKVIEKFNNLCKNRNGKLLIFYDKNQIIYKDRYPNWVINAECKLLLTKNCRNTFQIARTSNNILEITTTHNNNCINGEMPILCTYNNNYIEKIEYMINSFLSEGYNLQDITILTLNTENNSILSGIEKIGKYYISSTNNKTINEIFFTTSRKYKGLESNAVIVVDINESTFINQIDKNNFYVATSRAKQRLAIFIDENNISKIAHTIKDIKLSNNLGKISTKLKVKPFN